MSVPEGDESTILSVQRTRLASERTLMGWIRTAISLISFGFTISKALEYVEADHLLRGFRPQAPMVLGLTLIVLALVALFFACVQHVVFVRHLPATRTGRQGWDLTLLMAASIAILGLLLIINLAFNVGPQ